MLNKALVEASVTLFRIRTFVVFVVAQRGCGHPVPGGGQGQVRWGPGQLSWGMAAPPTEWCGTGWASGSLPTQNILWFYDWSALRETLSSGCGQAAQQHLSGQPETLQH